MVPSEQSSGRRVRRAVSPAPVIARHAACWWRRQLSTGGKKLTVVITALARELCGFVWAIGQAATPAPPQVWVRRPIRRGAEAGLATLESPVGGYNLTPGLLGPAHPIPRSGARRCCVGRLSSVVRRADIWEVLSLLDEGTRKVGGSHGSWSMKGLMMAGAAFAILGLIGLAVPVFTTQDTKEVAKIGDLKLQTTENTSHVIPPLLSEGALALGIILIGAGLYMRR